MLEFPPRIPGVGAGRIIFSPITRLPGGADYIGFVLVMLVNPDVRINALVAWATSVKQGLLSAIILLTTPETEPYARILERMLEKELLAPLEILVEKYIIPGTYDRDEARYSYFFNFFNDYLAGVIDRTIIDLTTGPNDLGLQFHKAASNAGAENFQTIEVLKTLINVPPFDRLREGVDYEIRHVSKVERNKSESPNGDQQRRLAITKFSDSVIETKNTNTGLAISSQKARVFVSYSHKDRRWLLELQTMLKPLVHNGAIDLWDDTKIQPGAMWEQEIGEALTSSKVAVLLVSANFLASDFITQNELPLLLRMAQAEGTTIFWIYVSSCLYKQTEIVRYQAAHDVSRPLDRMTKANRQAVLSEICALIKNRLH